MLTRREFGMLADVPGSGRLKADAAVGSGARRSTVRRPARRADLQLPRSAAAGRRRRRRRRHQGDDRLRPRPSASCGRRSSSRVRPRAAAGAPPSPEAVKAREDLRKWRLETPLDHFRARRKKFDAAGITIHAFNYSLNTSFTDAEIDRGFEMAKALGAEIITASTTLDVAQADRAVRREAPDDRRRCTTTRTSPTRTSSRRPRASPRR